MPQLPSMACSRPVEFSHQPTSDLNSRITAAITQAQDEVIEASSAGAGEIATLEAAIVGWQPPNPIPTGQGSGTATPMSTGTGGTNGAPAAPAPAAPGGSGVPNVNYDVGQDGADADHHPPTEVAPASNQNVNPGDGQQQPTKVEPAAATNGTTPPPSPATSAPSGGSSAGSVLGHMMSPMSCGERAGQFRQSGRGESCGGAVWRVGQPSRGRRPGSGCHCSGCCCQCGGPRPGVGEFGGRGCGGLGADGVRGDQRRRQWAWRNRQCGQPGRAERRSRGGAGTGTSGSRRGESCGGDHSCCRGRWCSDGDDAPAWWWGGRPAGDPGQRPAGGWAGHANDTGGTPTCQQQQWSGFGGELAARGAGGAAGDAATRGIGRIGADGATGDVLFEQAMGAGHDVNALTH